MLAWNMRIHHRLRNNDRQRLGECGRLLRNRLDRGARHWFYRRTDSAWVCLDICRERRDHVWFGCGIAEHGGGRLPLQHLCWTPALQSVGPAGAEQLFAFYTRIRVRYRADRVVQRVGNERRRIRFCYFAVLDLRQFGASWVPRSCGCSRDHPRSSCNHKHGKP